MNVLNIRLKAEKGLKLIVLIGVHTELVVAGEMGGGDTVEALAIVGETPNVAARFQEATQPSTLIVRGVTRRMIQGFFVREALGLHRLKGISDPMELFQLSEESGAQSRFDVAFATQLTPVVGREQEVPPTNHQWKISQEVA